MKHWNNHWQYSKTLSSFAAGDKDPSYQPDLTALWEQELSELPKQATIVDLACGNGALAAVIAEYAKKHGKDWLIQGIDSAAINPVAALKDKPELAERVRDVQFHGNTDMAKLPFADESVDCVLSQFGLEYGDTAAATKEILRVLKPGGKFVAIAQNKRAQLVKEASQGVEIFEHILNRTPLFLQADLFLRLAAMQLEKMTFAEWQQNQACLASKRTTEWIMQQLQEKYNKPEDRVWLNEIFGRVLELINYADTTEKATQAAEYLMISFNMLQDHQQRLVSHGEAALTAANAKKISKGFSQANATSELNEFNANEQLFAWLLKAQKPL